eukprot:Em0012g482a
MQPNSDTRSKQVNVWCDLVLEYFKANKNYILDVNEAQTSPLFCNSAINRKLSTDGIVLILLELEKRGNLEWQDKQKSRCLVMWRTPSEWGKLVYKWAVDSGLANSVCTLYEIHSGADTTSEEFSNIEPWMLKKTILALQSEGKAEYIHGINPDDSDAGVKFFT